LSGNLDKKSTPAHSGLYISGAFAIGLPNKEDFS